MELFIYYVDTCLINLISVIGVVKHGNHCFRLIDDNTLPELMLTRRQLCGAINDMNNVVC